MFKIIDIVSFFIVRVRVLSGFRGSNRRMTFRDVSCIRWMKSVI